MSEEAKPTISRWQILHERGVDLKDDEIDFITGNIVAGVQEALKFLGQEDLDWPKIAFSDNKDTIGYSEEREVINIPVPYLKQLEGSDVPLEDRLQTIYTLPNREPVQIPYPEWLRLAGREETIHHLKKKGLAGFKPWSSGHDFSKLSAVERLMCDIEVEARKTVDEISIHIGEEPRWRALDEYLFKAHPMRYNQPAQILMRMSKSKA